MAESSEVPIRTKFGMTSEQHVKAVAWMGKHAPDLKCEVCAHDKFLIALDFVSPPAVLKDGFIKDPDFFVPFFMVMCKLCGNTKFFNAIKAGVMESNLEPEPSIAAPPKPSPAAGQAGA